MGVVTAMLDRPVAGTGALRKLRALILLGGSVRPGRLSGSVGRPLFDLPLEAGLSILDSWRQASAELGAMLGMGPLPVRVMIDRAAPEPGVSGLEGSGGLGPVRIERDPFDYRGTGGVLRDVAAGYDEEDLLLVANAAQVLIEPLGGLASELAGSGGEVSLTSHLDGTTCGLFLVRCAAVREIPAAGFVDLKEQALPAIAARHRVMVVARERAAARPIRTLNDYIGALREHHKRKAGKTSVTDPFAEDWESAFAIVEEGAVVDAKARLHDAVVLRGGRVEGQGVVVHSIVCPGGVVGRGQMAVDELVAPARAGRSRR